MVQSKNDNSNHPKDSLKVSSRQDNSPSQLNLPKSFPDSRSASTEEAKMMESEIFAAANYLSGTDSSHSVEDVVAAEPIKKEEVPSTKPKMKDIQIEEIKSRHNSPERQPINPPKLDKKKALEDEILMNLGRKFKLPNGAEQDPDDIPFLDLGPMQDSGRVRGNSRSISDSQIISHLPSSKVPLFKVVSTHPVESRQNTPEKNPHFLLQAPAFISLTPKP